MSVGICNAGGGSHGIWGAGAMAAIHDRGIVWDGVVSSSVGTLNSLLAIQGRWDELFELWMTVKSSTVYNKYWFKGVCKPSLYDSAPLRKLIKSKIYNLRNLDKRFIITVTNLSTGRPETYEPEYLSDETIVDVLMASASPPVFFPPVEIKNQTMVDAGVTDNFGLVTAINEGFDTLLVIKYPQGKMKPIKNKIDALTNTLSAAMDSDYHKDLKAIKRLNEIADKCDEFDKTVKQVKVIEICTENPELLDYHFLDFDFKGLDRKAIWQDGYNTCLRALDKAGL